MPRVLIAVIAGLSGFVAYVLGVVTLADRVVPTPWWLQLAYFVAGGALWVVPARELMFWAARRPRVNSMRRSS